jgi:hypothetical protein
MIMKPHSCTDESLIALRRILRVADMLGAQDIEESPASTIGDYPRGEEIGRWHTVILKAYIC